MKLSDKHQETPAQCGAKIQGVNTHTPISQNIKTTGTDRSTTTMICSCASRGGSVRLRSGWFGGRLAP